MTMNRQQEAQTRFSALAKALSLQNMAIVYVFIHLVHRFGIVFRRLLASAQYH